MAVKEKMFKRGVGFTFTPSRVLDEGDVDYIDELNILLENSNLSQNKFMELMLKSAIEFEKMKNSGSLQTISKPSAMITTSSKIAQGNSDAENQRVPFAGGSVPVVSDQSPKESTSVDISTTKATEPVLTPESREEPNRSSVTEVDPVIQRALERSARAKLKQ